MKVYVAGMPPQIYQVCFCSRSIKYCSFFQAAGVCYIPDVFWQLYTTPIERRGCFLMCSITVVKGSSLAHRTMITTVY